MTIDKNSLVIFNNRPARVMRNSNKNTDVLFSNGKILKLPEKSLLLLHEGDFKKIDELVDVGEGSLYEAWLLLQGERANYRSLSELIFGTFTPNHAYATWLIVEQGVYFKLSQKIIFANRPFIVRKIKKAKEEEFKKSQEFEAFITRLKKRYYLPEDKYFIKEIVNFALGVSSHCRFFKFLNLKETMQNAHGLLLDIGFCSYSFNPYLSRFSISMKVLNGSVPLLPKKEYLDFSYMCSFAIDDKSSNDPDDAISFDKNTQKLWVHISDPASLVQPNSQIDKNARSRGCTLYLPEVTVPMLPKEITNRLALGLQSLCPALSIGFYVSDNGTIDDIEICLSYIRVKRLSYNEAEKKLLETPLLQFKKNSKKFYKFRKAHGAIDLHFPEVKIILHKSKVEIAALTFLESRSLVRSAMLMAGVAVAKFAVKHNICMPFSTQDLHELNRDNQNPRTVSEKFDARKNLQKSQYKTYIAPHTGMGLPYYVQVTSPLRRYLDLVVHQQLHSFLNKKDLLSEVEIFERIAEISLPNQLAHQVMHFSGMHWKCVYLAQNKDFQCDGIVIEKLQRNRVSVFIPQLSLVKKITISTVVELDQTILLKLDEVKVASQSIYFSPVL